MAVCIFRSCRAENRPGSKIFPENSDRSPSSERRDSIHASLRSSIRLLFYFFLFLSGFSLYQFRPFRYFFHPISPRAPRVYESNTRQSDTRNDRGKPRKSDGRSTCFATRNAEALRLACPDNFDNKKLARNRKSVLFSTLPISPTLPLTPVVAKRKRK